MMGNHNNNNNKAKRTEEEALNACLEVTRRMRDDASGAVTKTERDEWRARVRTHVAPRRDATCGTRIVAMSEKNFGLAFGAVEDVERVSEEENERAEQRCGRGTRFERREGGIDSIEIERALADFERQFYNSRMAKNRPECPKR